MNSSETCSFDEWAQDSQSELEPIIRRLGGDDDTLHLLGKALQLAFYGGWVCAVDREDAAIRRVEAAERAQKMAVDWLARRKAQDEVELLREARLKGNLP